MADLHIHVSTGLSQEQFSAITDLLQRVLQGEKQIMADEALESAALAKIDAATTKSAANIQALGDVAQTINNEIDALLAAQKAAGVSQAILDQTNSLATRSQALSDALDGQVVALQAVATKGAANPVPVPVPPVPTI